jgi:beta-glucanase (GH16 family)
MNYFANHRFYDFRFLAGSTSALPRITDSTDKGSTQDALKSDNFTKDWSIQDWSTQVSTDAPVALYNSPQNVYLTQTNNTDLGEDNADANTYLTLRTQRQPDFQSTAEVENTQNNLQYGTFRFRARVRGSSGACAGMFTFLNDQNEADIEILTRDSNGTIHYTNQPSVKKGNEVPGASIQVDNLASWTDWHTHRVDWLPGITRSYIDGKLVAQNKVNVPKKPSFIDVNMWSDGGVWTQAMAVGGEAELQIAWIQASFNTSGKIKRSLFHKKKRAVDEYNDNFFEEQPLSKRAAAKCSSICTIDDTQYSGTPEVTYTAGVSTNIAHMYYIIIGLAIPVALFFVC